MSSFAVPVFGYGPESHISSKGDLFRFGDFSLYTLGGEDNNEIFHNQQISMFLASVPDSYKYVVQIRMHNNSHDPLNAGFGFYFFEEKPIAYFDKGLNCLVFKYTKFYYASFILQKNGSYKFSYCNYYANLERTAFIYSSENERIYNLIDWDTPNQLWTNCEILYKTNFEIEVDDGSLIPDFDVDIGNSDKPDIPDYNKVDGYDESIFDKMPILDFSNCETPLNYIKTFFTWIWDMILWSVQLVKDFFKMLHNINTFITDFISNFVKQIVNTVKEIANKFIDTLIERVKDITNAVAEVVLEFLKKWFIPSEEFLNEHYSTLDKSLKLKIGDYSSVVEIFKNFFANLSGLRYRSAFASAPIIEGEYKGVTLAIDFSFLDPYIENIRLFIGGIMCVAQTWWFIRHLPSLIGRVPAANTKSYEPEKSSDSDSKSNKGG